VTKRIFAHSGLPVTIHLDHIIVIVAKVRCIWMEFVTISMNVKTKTYALMRTLPVTIYQDLMIAVALLVFLEMDGLENVKIKTSVF